MIPKITTEVYNHEGGGAITEEMFNEAMARPIPFDSGGSLRFYSGRILDAVDAGQIQARDLL